MCRDYISFMRATDRLQKCQVTPLRKRLYKELLDDQNYEIVKALAKELPGGMSVRQLQKVTGLEWTPTKYRVMRLAEGSLIKSLGRFRIVRESGKRSVCFQRLYKVRSRTLFEHGLLEMVLCRRDGVERLADALQESMKEHGVSADKGLIMNVATFTAYCVEHGLFDELREYASKRISTLSMLHSYHSEDLSIDFIKAFMASDLNRKILPIRFGAKATVNEIRLLFNRLMSQLRKADLHGAGV